MRFLTYNLAGLGHRWFEERADVATRGLRALAPDVICFQEATVRHSEKSYHQALAIAHGIDLRYVAFAPYGNTVEMVSHDEGGIAIASRWPFVTCRSRKLPPGHDHARDARSALFVTIDAPGGEVHVCNTHFSWKPEESDVRLVQMGIVLNEFLCCGWTDPASRAILAGDFNATEDEPAILFAEEKLRDAFRARNPDVHGFTWSHDVPRNREWNDPSRRLDYVFCPEGVPLRDARVVLDKPDPVFGSDHFGVLAEIDW